MVDKKTQGKKNRDRKGRFIKGHVPLSSVDKMIEYNKKNGIWNKGKKLPLQTKQLKEKKSQKMVNRHKNPTWDEGERRRKISNQLKGHEVTKLTREKLRVQGKKSKKKGTNFEYRAKKYVEELPGAVQVIRSGGSRDIDLTVIWSLNRRLFLISKEEVKSSLRWFDSLSKNPLSLLDKDDKKKLIESYKKGFQIYLICRKPKKKKEGKYCSRQTQIMRIPLKVMGGEIIYEEFK